MTKPVTPSQLIAGTCLVVILSGCSPASPTPTPTVTIEPTATTAPTVPGPTYTPTPIASPTPSPSYTPTFTETPAPTSTSEGIVLSIGETETLTSTSLPPGARPQITAIQNTNCHLKPKKESKVVGFFVKGMVFDIYGKDEYGIWVKIPNPSEDGYFCWVWTGSSKITGSLDNIPVNP